MELGSPSKEIHGAREEFTSEFVRVLQRAKSEHVRCLDFVEDRDFCIQIRIARERILFEVVDLVLDCLGVVSDRADCGHCGHVRAVGELDRSLLRLHAVEFVGGHAGEHLPVELERRSGGLLKAGVDSVREAGVHAVGVLSGNVPLLGE